MAVLGTPSSSCSRRIFFSAMVAPLVRSRALYTTPYVPSPIFSTFSYCAPPDRAPFDKPAGSQQEVGGVICGHSTIGRCGYHCTIEQTEARLLSQRMPVSFRPCGMHSKVRMPVCWSQASRRTQAQRRA